MAVHNFGIFVAMPQCYHNMERMDRYPAFDQLSESEVSGHLAKNRYVCFYSLPVIGKTEQPRACTLSPAGLHDNNKDQFDFGSKMQKSVLSMP